MMRLSTEMRNIKNMRKERKIKSRLVLFYLKFNLQGTISVISNDPKCKDDNFRFTTVPLISLSDEV